MLIQRDAPKFDHMIRGIEKARKAWEEGDHEKAERTLKLIASIAYAESSAPMPKKKMVDAD